MTLLIEDTARNNLASWTAEAVGAGLATGAVISPFSTPRYAGYKQSARKTVERLVADGAEVWLDPVTQALQMPAVGDFRYYDDWPLWTGPRGRLDTESDMQGHVDRVFSEQSALGAAHLAPTVLLHSPQSKTSEQALELARVAIETDPDCVLSIAGDSAFWAAGASLDAHIGALAQLEPGGWWLTVVRPLTILPVAAIAEEVHGLCRTARALREDGPVHISHGDLAALPAVAAGATSIGTGWDPRQRGCAYGSYEARDAGGDGGQWFKQVTFQGLLSLLTNADANILAQRDQNLASQLAPGQVPPGPKEAFFHHIKVLSTLVTGLTGLGPKAAHDQLEQTYASARVQWDAVAKALGIKSRADAWISPMQDGLQLFGSTEGF